MSLRSRSIIVPIRRAIPLNLESRLQQLETEARQLEVSPEQGQAMIRAAGDYAERFVAGLDAARTYTAGASDRADWSSGFAEEGSNMQAIIDTIASRVDHLGINPASGGHLGYIPGGGIFPAAVGDFLADVGNRYSGVEFASPGAVEMERSLIRWMTQLVGYPEGAGGDLTSGGSMANLTGLVTAREARAIHARDIPRSPVYCTAQVHHCIDKALRVAGLAECPRREVPMDDCYRMCPDTLAQMVQEDRASGLNPWLVVASAGTTDTGAVDPVDAIAEVAQAENLWLHLDAAYGGFFLLCDEGRVALGDLGRADSIVMDPHKGLFLPYGSGALLVKNVHDLARAHGYEANYMLDAREGSQDYSPADLSAELSRPFRGLRLWLPLRVFGLAPFRAALSEKIWLARYFHERIRGIPGFEVGPEPDLSVVTYRYVPAGGNANEFNRRLLQAVLDDGRLFISSTRLNGDFVLRLAVLHYRTHRSTIDELLSVLQSAVSHLQER
jgi:glutamate/tyrosine decarboxylase-like PLP-dependent enzyme